MKKTKVGATKVSALVISDAEGNYFVVPREILELSKVSREARDEVEKLLRTQRKKPMNLRGGFSFVGALSLSEETNWRHYSPDIAWPN